MAQVSVYAGTFCLGRDTARRVADELSYEFMDDSDLVERAAQRFSLEPERVFRTLSGKVSVFNRFTHEQQRIMAFLKVILAEVLERDRLVLFGAATHLIPKNISHVLSVCCIADIRFRVEQAVREGLDGSGAGRNIKKDDEAAFDWAEVVHGKPPFDPSLYDILIPMDNKTVEQAAAVIVENARKAVVMPSAQSMAQVRDFALAAHVEAALARQGHEVDVQAEGSRVTLVINKHAVMLQRLQEELTSIAKGLAGVEEVECRVGSGFHQSDIYRKVNFETPPRYLLVDDEQEFVQTLSDRLEMRDMGSAVVYDGEQALALVEQDEPEVMVLDLNLPGMNGVEVLQRIKDRCPAVEVIIVTGHGSEKDEKICRELGCFDYLEKPVNIDVLAQKMREAHQKVLNGRKKDARETRKE